MAECKDIGGVLTKLNKKIDDQNKLIQDLQKQLNKCCGSNSNNNRNRQNLTDIYKRLAKIEAYINALDNAGLIIKKGLEAIKNIFIGN